MRFPFVTGSTLAVYTLPVSMLPSLRSVAMGAYVTEHLGTDALDDPEGYETMQSQ